MRFEWKHYWFLFLGTFAIYLVMVLWSLPLISDAAGGLIPFDMRPSGYSFEEVKAFLSSLSKEGAYHYENTQLRLDTAYPGLLALVLAIGAMGLASGRLRWIGYVVVLGAVVGAVGDYAENHMIGRLLSAGAEAVTESDAALASQFTLVKSIATSVAMSLILVLLLVRGFFRLRNRKSAG